MQIHPKSPESNARHSVSHSSVPNLTANALSLSRGIDSAPVRGSESNKPAMSRTCHQSSMIVSQRAMHLCTRSGTANKQAQSEKMSAHKKSSRKVRCPRGAEDDALKIPGAGGLEFDIESGILAITHRTLFNFNTTETCSHPCEQRTVCPQQLTNQLPMQDRLEIENQMQSVCYQSLNMLGRIGGCISEGQDGFTTEIKFFHDCMFHGKTGAARTWTLESNPLQTNSHQAGVLVFSVPSA